MHRRHSLGILYCCLCLTIVSPAWTFSFSVSPSSPGVNQAFEISWVYRSGEAAGDQFAIEVQGFGGYLQWHGFFNASGSTQADAVSSTGNYTISAYSGNQGTNTGTFASTFVLVQEQASGGTTTTTAPQIATPQTDPPSSPKSSFSPSTIPKGSNEITTTTSTAAATSSSFQPSSKSHITAFTSSPASSGLSSPGPGSSINPVISSASATPGGSSGLSPTPSSSAAATGASSSGTTGADSSSAPSPTRDLIIGISAGAGTLFLLLLSIVVYWIRRRRENKGIARKKARPYAYESTVDIVRTSDSSTGPLRPLRRTQVFRIPPSKESALPESEFSSSATAVMPRAVQSPVSERADGRSSGQHVEVSYDVAPPSYRETTGYNPTGTAASMVGMAI